MAPISPVIDWQSHVVDNRMDDQCDSASTLELIVITVAVINSFALALASKMKNLNSSRYPVFTCCIVSLALFCTGAAFVLSFTTLILGWFRKISLDAIGAIVFALAPAILSVPSHIFRYFHSYHLMRRLPSLRVATQEFRFVRYGMMGKTCGSDKNAKHWDKTWDVCTKENCTVRMFIRYLPQPINGYRDSIVSMAFSQVYRRDRNRNPKSNYRDSSGARIDPALQWYGYRKGHTQNFVELQDVDDGITSWWWHAVSSAHMLVAKPLTVHVSNKLRMVNALALISDIISIGDLVLEHRFEFLQHELKTNRGIQASITATPGIMCNMIMEKVGLSNWFPIEAEALIREGYNYPLERKKYGMLFLILAEKSSMFASLPRERKVQREKQCPLEGRCPLRENQEHHGILRKSRIPMFSKGEPQRISGQYIVDQIIRHGSLDHQLFKELSIGLVDEWLCDWGFRRDQLS